MKIALIGAGNVATHLGPALQTAGAKVVQVFSRKMQNARPLAEKLAAAPTTNLADVRPETDLLLLAVADDAIAPVAAELLALGHRDTLLAHTSGATPLASLVEVGAQRCGVFYPLQTFSKQRTPDFTQIPFLVDARQPEDLALLRSLAGKISPQVHHIADEKRAVLHVAAVFVNNFTNHLCAVADDLLRQQKLPLQLLLPLLRETVDKLAAGSPDQVQTGPARRGDAATIRRHLELLAGHPEYAETYRLLTRHIQERFH